MNCLCGRVAKFKALLPLDNVYAGLKQVMEWHNVCEYHAQKARERGFEVV